MAEMGERRAAGAGDGVLPMFNKIYSGLNWDSRGL